MRIAVMFSEYGLAGESAVKRAVARNFVGERAL